MSNWTYYVDADGMTQRTRAEQPDTRTARAIITGAAAVAFAGTAIISATAPAPAALEMAPVLERPAEWWGTLPPCDDESGTRNGRFGCYWDASRGNGEGTSFYTTANGTTVSLPNN